MNKEALAQAVRTKAEAMKARLERQIEKDNDHAAYGNGMDEVELLRILARIVEGLSIEKAFGAPGGFGYGTPIGDALAGHTGATCG